MDMDDVDETRARRGDCWGISAAPPGGAGTALGV